MEATVEPSRRVGGGMAEAFFRPTTAQDGQMASFEVRATSGDVQTAVTGTFEIMAWEDDGPAYANSLLAIFLPYVSAHHPELGLGPDVTWIESWNSQPVLVVTHRSYLSSDWELHVAWHNTIPPHDWAYVLGRRRDELDPEIGFCIASQAEDHAVQLADLSDPRLPCAR